tara:strand:+ start:49 stop:1122 length:1074 start_codon:yes stop_codon:yes gene_type:complete
MQQIITPKIIKMIRTVTRPPSAKCDLPIYVSFLLSEPKNTSCLRLSEVENMSHDSVNRFLNRETYAPSDLFDEVKKYITLEGGTLSVDDTVIDKPYANYIAYIGYFWSGKHHKSVKGLNLITLFYTDAQGRQQPVNYRIYDKKENKSKNDYFLEMLDEVLAWGLRPYYMTGDSWYSCVKNLKQIKNHQLNFLFAIASNRKVSLEKGHSAQVQQLDIPEDGVVVWLKDFGYVKIFRTHLKDQVRHYAMHLAEGELNQISKDDFENIHAQHWEIEQYHRTIKQVCHIEHFQVRGKVAVNNHCFSALFAFVQLQVMRVTDVINNCYRFQRDLFNEAISNFICEYSPKIVHMKPIFQAVNA